MGTYVSKKPTASIFRILFYQENMRCQDPQKVRNYLYLPNYTASHHGILSSSYSLLWELTNLTLPNWLQNVNTINLLFLKQGAIRSIIRWFWYTIVSIIFVAENTNYLLKKYTTDIHFHLTATTMCTYIIFYLKTLLSFLVLTYKMTLLYN